METQSGILSILREKGWHLYRALPDSDLSKAGPVSRRNMNGGLLQNRQPPGRIEAAWGTLSGVRGRYVYGQR